MNDFKLTETHTGKTRYFDSKAAAQDAKEDLEGLTEGELTIERVDGQEVAQAPEVVEDSQNDAQEPETTVDIPQEPSIEKDPVDWLPTHFVDEIQGVPTLNRKGYAVMCERFGVSVTAEPITLASETDFEFAEFSAKAVTEDGTEYSGFGSAHLSREDGDDPYLLNELAETRAMKRAVSWATGIGMTAASEMKGEL